MDLEIPPFNISNHFDYEFDFSIEIPIQLVDQLEQATTTPIHIQTQKVILRDLEEGGHIESLPNIMDVEFCKYFIKGFMLIL